VCRCLIITNGRTVGKCRVDVQNILRQCTVGVFYLVVVCSGLTVCQVSTFEAIYNLLTMSGVTLDYQCCYGLW
jgi:hypothetical protein